MSVEVKDDIEVVAEQSIAEMRSTEIDILLDGQESEQFVVDYKTIQAGLRITREEVDSEQQIRIQIHTNYGRDLSEFTLDSEGNILESHDNFVSPSAIDEFALQDILQNAELHRVGSFGTLEVKSARHLRIEGAVQALAQSDDPVRKELGTEFEAELINMISRGIIEIGDISEESGVRPLKYRSVETGDEFIALEMQRWPEYSRTFFFSTNPEAMSAKETRWGDLQTEFDIELQGTEFRALVPGDGDMLMRLEVEPNSTYIVLYTEPEWLIDNSLATSSDPARVRLAEEFRDELIELQHIRRLGRRDLEGGHSPEFGKTEKGYSVCKFKCEYGTFVFSKDPAFQAQYGNSVVVETPPFISENGSALEAEA